MKIVKIKVTIKLRNNLKEDIDTRLWHYELIPYLPDLQFKGQLRELVAIMHGWRDKGETNHLLINKVMEYGKSCLTEYFKIYKREYYKRYHKILEKQTSEFESFAIDFPFIDKKDYKFYDEDWHNKTYLRVCMANLYEKHLSIGKSRVTDEEWQKLCDGYKKITGEEYKI